MYKGDYRRKFNLSEYGFRLPSCLDNRPLKFEEWDKMRPQSIFVSATPSNWELEQTSGIIVEQIIRPTGLLDPKIIIKSTKHQIDDLIDEIQEKVNLKEKVLATTLTKKMAEELSKFLNNIEIRSKYIHSDIDTIERVEIMEGLRNDEETTIRSFFKNLLKSTYQRSCKSRKLNVLN
jgi:excinuclease ABC subunit B